MPEPQTKLPTRDRIKGAAQRLIAEHGVDGVSVRDIVVAAGQKNMASLHYYFGTKEQLIKELVVDAAELMEGRRAAALKALAANGSAASLRDIVAITLGGAVVDPAENPQNANVMRFLGAVVGTHRHLYDEAIGRKHNKSYQKCLDLIRSLVPDVPLAVLNQRLLFMSILFFNTLIAREAGIAEKGHSRAYWSAERTLQNLVDFACAALNAPVRSGSEAAVKEEWKMGALLAGGVPGL